MYLWCRCVLLRTRHRHTHMLVVSVGGDAEKLDTMQHIHIPSQAVTALILLSETYKNCKSSS